METEERPWGKFSVLQESSRYKVKRIEVNAGAKLSLQQHFHRAEHWVVVRGTALVEIDNAKVILNENQSTYFPIGAVDRLSNLVTSMLQIIEVQSGQYLGEDDIVRFEDSYGRKVA